MRKLIALLAFLAPLAAVKSPIPKVIVATPTAHVDPTLIGGTPAKPEDWPASVYARMSGAACSATVVGEKVLLIASHCVSNGGTATFAVGTNNYSARCTHHPDYRRDSTADWALCLVDKTVAGGKYEMVAVDREPVACASGQTWRLTGYGCVRAGGGGGNDGVFRIGTANVQSCPNRDHDTVTKGGAALCYGDSGGAAYLERGDGTRAIVGVNSRGDIRTTSYLSSTYDGTFKTWATTWANANGGQKICGLHADAVGCRDGANPPPPPPPPPADCVEQVDAAVEAQMRAGATLQAVKACVAAGE